MEPNVDDPFPGSLVLGMLLVVQAPLISYLLQGFALLILLLLSGLISGSEVAFFSLSPEDRLKLSEASTIDKNIAELLRKPKRLLATILVLNNLVNVSFITLSTYISWTIAGTKSLSGWTIVLMTTVITFAIVYFGEVVPKIFANQRNLRFSRLSAPLIFYSFKFLRPVSWLLTSFTGLIEHRIKKGGYEVSVDDLHQALELTTEEGTTEEEKEILKGIVNFGQLTVTQVMTSRVDFTAFDFEIDFHELMDKINKSGYSRIPVFHDTIDEIKGILYNKDLLPHLNEKETFQWQTLLRPAFFVPETKKIDTLLKDFQEKHVHMAIVVDEYGGTSGLITMEDVMEEIVGEINDEDEEEDLGYQKIDDDTYVFEGKTSLNDFSKIVGAEAGIFDGVKGESESIGGLLLELNHKLPNVGEQITFKRFNFTVVSVDLRRIRKVRVTISSANP